jgi:hypothetical protein
MIVFSTAGTAKPESRLSASAPIFAVRPPEKPEVTGSMPVPTTEESRVRRGGSGTARTPPARDRPRSHERVREPMKRSA